MNHDEIRETCFDSIESAIADIASGKMVIVTDDEARENEGDLVMAASKVSPQAINQMILHARGLICVPMHSEQLRALDIHLMASENRESHKTDFTVSVDAAEGITTGISAYDRAETIRILGDANSEPDMLVRPGHVFPLRAKPGGVLQRAGHTEAAVDLAKLAGLNPSGVICEILKEDGTLARLPDMVQFKEKHGLKLISIADLIEYRHTREKLVRHLSTQPFESEFGRFNLHIFKSTLDNRHHLAFSMGQLDECPTLVRVQRENRLGDIFRSTRLNGYHALKTAMQTIAKAKHGVLLYIEQPPGDHPANQSEEIGPRRDYGIGAQILVELGLKQIRLMSGSQRKAVGIDAYNLEIVEQIRI